MIRVALYVRVSTEEQKKHGLSVDNQIEALKLYARENKYKVVDVYNDAGFSASKSYKTRPALNRMIADVQDKKIDLILFTKLDRFFRNVPDYYAVMEKLGAVPWRAIWEDYETETSSGKFKVNIMLSVSQSEADRTSERICNVFEYKKARGEVCSGGCATGYVIQDKRWVIDKETEPAVRAFFSTYLSTFSLKKAIMSARSNGLPNMKQSLGTRMLYSDAYWGNAYYVSEPYITKEEHELILKVKPYKKVHQVKHSYIFSGLCKCSICGGNLIGERTVRTRKDGSVHHSIRYSCTPRHTYEGIHVSIAEPVLENYMISNIAEQLEGYNVSITDVTNSSNATALVNLKARLRRVRDLYELGDISLDEYKQKRALLNNDIELLEAKTARKVRNLPHNWREIYEDLDAEHKRVFWSNLIDHIEITERSCTAPVIYF